MKKIGFTLEQHRMVGAQLNTIVNDLDELSAKIENAYTLTFGDEIYEAVKHIDRVRSYLDDQVMKENRKLDTPTLVSVYYGGNPDAIEKDEAA
jgi:hypothetical protein